MALAAYAVFNNLAALTNVILWDGVTPLHLPAGYTTTLYDPATMGAAWAALSAGEGSSQIIDLSTGELAVAQVVVPNRTLLVKDSSGSVFAVPAADAAYSTVTSNVVTIDFGAVPTPEASVAVTFSGQPLGMRVRAWFSGRSTSDNTVTDHVMAQAMMKLSVGNYITNGFTIFADSIGGLVTGTFKLNWAWI